METLALISQLHQADPVISGMKAINIILITIFWFHLFLLSVCSTAFAQSSEQKKLMAEIKNDERYFFIEYTHQKANHGRENAIEKFYESIRKSTQFYAKTKEIAQSLALPNYIHLQPPTYSVLSAAIIQWERRNRTEFFVYLKREEAISQLATNYRLISSDPNEKWYLGQGIDSDRTISNQLANNDLSQHFGVLTNATQTFVQSVNTNALFDRYTQEITQQRTVLLHGQSTAQLSWGPALVASYSAISEKAIKEIDEELASEIRALYSKAEDFFEEQEIEAALYNYYLAYLTSILLFNEQKIEGESAPDLILAKLRLMFTDHLRIEVGRTYLLNDETVAVPILLSHQNGINQTYDIVYQDYTGETITQLIGGNGKLYLKNPTSTSPSLVIPTKIAIQLKPIDKNNAKWAIVDDAYKGWTNNLVSIDLSAVQEIKIECKYNETLARYEMRLKTAMIEVESVEWQVGNQTYQGPKLYLYKAEMMSQTVSMQINEEPNWVRSIKIDTVNHSAVKTRLAAAFPKKEPNFTSLPIFYSFIKDYQNPVLLIRELNRLKNLGKVQFGNIDSMPTEGDYVLVSFSKSAILQKYLVQNEMLLSIDGNRVKNVSIKKSEFVETAPALVWFKMNKE